MGAPAANGKPNGEANDAPTEPEPVVVDLAGIADRLIAAPFSEGRYTGVAGAAGRILCVVGFR